MGGVPSVLREPWRELPQNNTASFTFVKSYRPQNKKVKQLRILLHGPVGAGKSSFINSVDSALQNRVCTRAPTDAISGTSFTCQYKTYKIHRGPGSFYSFIFNDIMGLENETAQGVPVEDIKLALRGHVRDGYEFQPGNPLKEGDQYYNSSPTLQDKVHVLVCVIPASSVSLLSDEVVEKIRDIRLAASQMEIPQLIILTKVDEACPVVKKDLRNTYKSKYLKELVDKIHMVLGVQLNCILLVKNYSSESELNDCVNALMLCALKQMILCGEDFLNNL
ncbi:hypothetical protein INR49_011192 [Caranx melampygus]|nr:hypothetical protein INR49_011192 [Caranx melampygus]